MIAPGCCSQGCHGCTYVTCARLVSHLVLPSFLGIFPKFFKCKLINSKFSPHGVDLQCTCITLYPVNAVQCNIYAAFCCTFMYINKFFTHISVPHFSYQNTELIERLQECINKREAGVLNSNNNTNDREEQPLPSTSSNAVDGHKELGNITFEIIDSKIPTDEHVHVNSGDSSVSKISNELPTKEMTNRVVPDSTSEPKGQEKQDSETESTSRRVLKELDQENASGQ